MSAFFFSNQQYDIFKQLHACFDYTISVYEYMYILSKLDSCYYRSKICLSTYSVLPVWSLLYVKETLSSLMSTVWFQERIAT